MFLAVMIEMSKIMGVPLRSAVGGWFGLARPRYRLGPVDQLEDSEDECVVRRDDRAGPRPPPPRWREHALPTLATAVTSRRRSAGSSARRRPRESSADPRDRAAAVVGERRAHTRRARDLRRRRCPGADDGLAQALGAADPPAQPHVGYERPARVRWRCSWSCCWSGWPVTFGSTSCSAPSLLASFLRLSVTVTTTRPTRLWSSGSKGSATASWCRSSSWSAASASTSTRSSRIRLALALVPISLGLFLAIRGLDVRRPAWCAGRTRPLEPPSTPRPLCRSSSCITGIGFRTTAT